MAPPSTTSRRLILRLTTNPSPVESEPLARGKIPEHSTLCGSSAEVHSHPDLSGALPPGSMDKQGATLAVRDAGTLRENPSHLSIDSPISKRVTSHKKQKKSSELKSQQVPENGKRLRSNDGEGSGREPRSGDDTRLATKRRREDKWPKSVPGLEVSDCVAMIKENYPVGGCTMHPTKHCYLDTRTGLHFDVGSGSRLYSWARRLFDGDQSVTPWQHPTNAAFAEENALLTHPPPRGPSNLLNPQGSPPKLTPVVKPDVSLTPADKPDSSRSYLGRVAETFRTRLKGGSTSKEAYKAWPSSPQSVTPLLDRTAGDSKIRPRGERSSSVEIVSVPRPSESTGQGPETTLEASSAAVMSERGSVLTTPARLAPSALKESPGSDSRGHGPCAALRVRPTELEIEWDNVTLGQAKEFVKSFPSTLWLFINQHKQSLSATKDQGAVPCSFSHSVGFKKTPDNEAESRQINMAGLAVDWDSITVGHMKEFLKNLPQFMWLIIDENREN